MKLLRNREVLHELLIFSCFTVFFTILAAIFSPVAAVFCFLLGITLALAMLCFVKRRYEKIEKLCNDIDNVLLNEDKILFDDMKEGELSVLNSEIHKLTVRLREQNEALKNDKLLMKNSVEDISHQLRTPLTSMNFIVSKMSKRDISEDELLCYTKELSLLLNRTKWLIESLLKMSRIDAGVVEMKFSRIDCADIIKTAIYPLEIAAELKNVSFNINAEKSMFDGDFNWCCEALTNILKNCVEHSPNDTNINICAGENPLYTQIIINDCGKGFSEHDLMHIFDRFYKADNSNSTGFGIGLSLAKQIIGKNNGTLIAENASPFGARFVIRFYKSVV